MITSVIMPSDADQNVRMINVCVLGLLWWGEGVWSTIEDNYFYNCLCVF